MGSRVASIGKIRESVTWFAGACRSHVPRSTLRAACAAAGKAARGQAVDAAQRLGKQADQAAEATAQQFTCWTGRKMTGAQVKRTALVAGVAMAAVAVVSAGAVVRVGAAVSRAGLRRAAVSRSAA